VLKQMFGEVTVPVRQTDDELNYFFGQSGKSTMKLGEYIDAITGPPTRGVTRPYLGNIPFDHPRARQHLQRLKTALPFPDYFPNQVYGEMRLWMGAEGQRSTIQRQLSQSQRAAFWSQEVFAVRT